ncbi:ibrB domain protein [Salmonella enterica]|nr:ibrB domain protein [Salmonella enterica]EDT7939650.1 ibrB domain protein [Salmonella enterica subsp. enterica serovar Aba]EDX1478816.1 ibrB domain protein [Salmonella enterica subsp. enterica serovar Bonariensis]EEO8062630.1 ibrB domain protein [Salmonella enterica]EHF7848719.1 ibrB domain protein [Salmonella enterica]
MSNQVRDLARQGWRIDAGEVLPLKQIIGLAELFGDETFSQVWAVE